MLISTIIFILSLLVVFGMLVYSAKQVRLGKRQVLNIWVPDVSFRKIEKVVLYYTKNIVQITIVTVVKYSLITVLRTKKTVKENWPHFHLKLKKVLKKEKSPSDKPSFFQKAVLESKTKIRRVKDRVKKEHAKKEQEELKVEEKV